MRIINDKVHGSLDYLVALTLIAAPFGLGFSSQSSFAHWMSVAGGLGLLLYSLITGYSYSVRSLLTFPQHLVLDAAAGLAFLAAPFVAGFGGVPRIFFVATGLAVLVVVGLTDPQPTQARPLR